MSVENNKNLISIVIRTLNEERYLREVLTSIANQKIQGLNLEVVIIDSGSTDKTLEIAFEFGARVTFIKKEDFSFGRSLNRGCAYARGEFLVFISGHCIPASDDWLINLVDPLRDGRCSYTYGRQVGRDSTKFSEIQLFEKFYPLESRVPQVGFFCNNANAAIRRDVWEKYKFDEELTGCEDMYLSKQIYLDGGKIGYVSTATVYHIHDETWRSVRIRYEREAIALQKIMPEVQIYFMDMVHYIFVGVIKDFRAAIRKKVFLREGCSIVLFRFMQFYGSYKGNHEVRKLSYSMKLKYFYPRVSDMEVISNERK